MAKFLFKNTIISVEKKFFRHFVKKMEILGIFVQKFEDFSHCVKNCKKMTKKICTRPLG